MTYHAPHRPDEPSAMAEALAHTRSLPDLLTNLFRDVSDLFRKEGELIRSEMHDKVNQLQMGVGKIAAGAIVVLVALIVLTQALVVAVANLITAVAASGAENTAADVVAANTGWASLIVGAIFAAVGAFLIRSGTTDLNVENLTPDRTALQVRRDAELAKEQMQ